MLVVNQEQHIKEVWGRLFSTPATQGSLSSIEYFLGAYITISQSHKKPSEALAGWLIPNKQSSKRNLGNSESY